MVIHVWSLLLFGLLPTVSNAGPPAIPHPVHVSVTELDARGARIALRIRVFAEDFPPGSNEADARRYLARHVTLAGPSGRPVSLTWSRSWADGDLRYVELAATIPNGLAGHRLVNTLLFDRFEDQVNVVQIREAGRRRATLIFTRRESAQVIR